MTNPAPALNLRTLWRLVGPRTMVLMTLACAVGGVRAWVRRLLHRVRPEVETAPEGGE